MQLLTGNVCTQGARIKRQGNNSSKNKVPHHVLLDQEEMGDDVRENIEEGC